MTDKTAPRSQLRLEWVYGYRGHQCRNNLFHTASNDVVYFVAGVGVVYDAKNRSQRFFLGHCDDIISLALHPDRRIVATGQIGKDPVICVWDSVTMETASIVQGGHERGVTCLGFSSDGQKLVSVGLDDQHTIAVWNWKRGKMLASARGHTDRVFDAQFSPVDGNLLVTCGVKHIKFWTLRGNSLEVKKGVFGKAGEIQTLLCLAFGQEDVTYTGTLSGDIYQWKGTQLSAAVQGAHSGPIFTLSSSEEGFASGSRDGSVRLWDKGFKPITKLDIAGSSHGYPGLSVRSVSWVGDQILVGTKDSEIFEISVRDRDRPRLLVQGHSEGELWGLAVHHSKNVFMTSSDDQTVRLWNMDDKALVGRKNLDQKARSAAFSPDGVHLAVGLMDGSFIVFRSKDLSDVTRVKDRKEVIHEMKYSPDGTHLAVGSNDNFVDIYSVTQRYKRVGQCSANSSFITHLDFSQDSRYIQTNSGAGERLFYKLPAGKRVTGRDEVRAIHWATWTGVLGEEVNGIWEKYTDTNDVNATDVAFEQEVIATGDDFGLVKIFRFPCVKKGAKFRKYVGHSAHVTNVRFSHNKRRLISAGGADHAIFQWRFLPEGSEEYDASDQGPEGVDSNDEASDSDLSDVPALDSDVEQEQQVKYDRPLYREDMPKLKEQFKKEAATANQSIKGSQKRQKAPSGGLKLEFVHGYRGYDCRSNLFYMSSGEIVYHVAAVGIVYTKESHSQRHYLAHTDDILCLSLHPARDVVATGQVGRDPAVHVWDTNSMQTLSILKGGHSRGVCAVDFSGDGKRLASVGLDDNHCIVVWNWKKGEKMASVRGHQDKIFVIRWNPQLSDQLVTVGIKHIKFWTQTGGGFTSKRGIFGDAGKLDTMLCVTHSQDGKTVLSGAINGMVYVWNGTQLASTVKAHTGPVFAVQTVDKGYITGGKDGVVCLWDDQFRQALKTFKIQRSALSQDDRPVALYQDLPPVRSIALGQGRILVGTKNGEIIEINKAGPMSILAQGHMEGEVWGLTTHPSELVCATVSDDHTCRVWDLARHRMKAVRKLAKASRAVGYSPDGKALAVGYNDGSFSVVDSSSLEDIASFHHRKEEISDIKFSPGTGKYLAVASHDNFVDIYNVLSSQRVGVCKGASSYITHVDWDANGKLLQVNSGAREQLFFEAPRGKRQTIRSTEVEKMNWSSWTCVLGNSCTGIWPPSSDVTDVNASHLTSDKGVLATGDDFGFVKLFEYPVKGKFGKFKKYVGHSAHVTNVRWTVDDAKLVSIGGADTAIMVWKQAGGGELAAVGSAAAQADSEESDSEFEEDGGYDSDVQREKETDYKAKTYANPIREMTGTKPHMQEVQDGRRSSKPRVSRGKSQPPKVQRGGAASGARKLGSVQDLSLSFVHGYRGFDTRNNLHYLSDAEVVYHAAAVGVVHDVATSTQSFYLQHTDDILCLAVNRHPKLKTVVATGQLGADAAIHVWDGATKETLSVIKGHHTDGVCSVSFSSSGKLLLSVGIDPKHTVVVTKWSDGAKLASADGHSQRIFVAEFRPDSDSQFVTCGVKHVKFWTLAGSELIGRRGCIISTTPPSQGDGVSGDATKMQTMLCCAFGAEGVTFTGSMSGDVFVWSGHSLARTVSRAHTGPIFTMFTTLKDGLIVTGAKEKMTIKDGGAVKLWDHEMKRCRAFSLGNHVQSDAVKSVSRGGKGKILVGTRNGEIIQIAEKGGALQTIINGHGEGEIWGLATHPSKLLFATASADHTVRLWDLEKMSMIRKVDVGGPARSLAFIPDGSLIAVGMKNGEFLLLNGATLDILARKRDRHSVVHDIRFSPDGRYLALGNDDGSVDFYGIRAEARLTRAGICKGIPSYVTQLDWSADSKLVKVSTGTYETLIFSAPSGSPVPLSDASAVTWASWTSALGPEVVGIWPKNADRGDVNCVHLANGGKTLVSGDDFGLVKLFDFPAEEKHAKHKKYVGHSAHVTNVRFSSDDKYLVSTGGDDCCVLVWRCH